MEIESLVDEYKSWENANEYFTSFDYIGLKCNTEQVYIVSKLFFPDISIIADCFLLKDSRQKFAFKECWNRATSVYDIEKYINFISIANNIKTEKNNEFLITRELTAVLKQSWELYFSKKHEDLDLIVETYEDEYDGWCITVYQKESIEKPKPSLDEFFMYLKKCE